MNLGQHSNESRDSHQKRGGLRLPDVDHDDEAVLAGRDEGLGTRVQKSQLVSCAGVLSNLLCGPEKEKRQLTAVGGYPNF